MPLRLGDHARRLAELRGLLAPRERRSAHRFLFEGPTLLAEAQRSGLLIEEIYATEKAYASTPLVSRLEAAGTPVWTVSAKAARLLSDVESPTGLFAVAPRRLAQLDTMFACPGAVLVLADLADPGNAGALVRAAEAFGAAGVVFGSLGVDPYHPKVVRAAMGSVFRIPVSLAAPQALEKAAIGRPAIVGLDAGGEGNLGDLTAESVLVVGHERRGLGRWRPICRALVRIPIASQAESLNAAIAGAVSLYEASRRTLT